MEYSDMQLLKRSFFAMRNGVVADVLRRGGSSFKVIFGLNLPQIAEVARQFAPDRHFAEQVWANSSTRESRLIAPMLMPREDFTIDDARRWIGEIQNPEVADVLCLKLLRHEPYALDLARELMAAGDDMTRYAGVRLMCNLAPQHPAEAVSAGQAEMARNCPLTRQAAAILLSYGEE